ncbi:unnamed protein product [Rotaria sp. Silwood1]|nr:unnamed protein product [Rotaria sp. Silwood1]CAF1182805.1 unnamed protein product [Rotaria sp. Silwood1]CAF3436307.1 unnamed protein product [Rotaria sp. Silwood1]CAF3480982.1 unnamed protein product [Rotaria sp. Silwood1]CAF4710980.1 unnamed protein product [Rotaria sp. Silwood1]
MNVLLKFFAAGSYAIIYIYVNELIRTGIRNTGMGICSIVARIGAIVGTTSNDILTRLWINLPTVLFGILSLIAAFLVLMLPETLNRTLPQIIEDTEQMGLTCTCIRDDQRTSEQEGQINIKNNDHDLNEDRLLNENLKGINDS